MVLAENYTTGAKGVTWNDTDNVNDGEIYRNDGADIQICAEGKANIFNIVAGEWLSYTLSVPQTTKYKLEFRVASKDGVQGAFHVEVDGVDKTGPIAAPRTNDPQIWTSVFLSDITLNAGSRKVRICMDKPGFNFANFLISYDRPAPATGKKITLKAMDKYLTFNAQNQLVCDATSITPECVFTVEQSTTGKYVQLKASNGRYVSAKGLKVPMTVETASSSASMLVWNDAGTNQVGLKGALINAIVCSENGTKPVNCNRYEIGAWEKFTWAEYTGSSIEAQEVVESELQVYPVPVAASKPVTVNFNVKETSQVSIQIIDLQGRVCKSLEQAYNAGNQKIDVSTSGIPSGPYMLRVLSPEFSITKKLLVL
ncbi:carbohydrate-binding protein [Viscerimonas tarda]